MRRSIAWPTVPLGDIATTQYGLSAPASADGTVPIVGMQHVQKGTLVLTGLSRVTIEHGEIAKFRLRAGDLLFNRTNSAAQVGKTAIVRQLGREPIVFASYLVRLVVDRTRAMPAFVNYVMNTEDALQRLRSLATPGVSQYNINPTTLCRKFALPLPPLEEQAAIVRILSLFDAAVQGTAEVIALKARRKAGLMQQLLSGERRVVPSRCPEWKEQRLGELFRERVERNHDGLPLLSITADRGVIARDTLDRKDTSATDKGQYLRIAPGDIGYNTMRMWQGVSALSEMEGIVSPAYTICIPGREVDGGFASYLFKWPTVVHIFRRFSQGLVDDTLNLKFHHFAQIRLRLPPLEEQRAIAEVLSAVDREILLLARQSELIERQRQAVTHRLLSGEIRVPPNVVAETLPA